MGNTWKHPQLGKFEYDGMAWVRDVDAPAFDAFAYDVETPAGKYEMAFEADDENDLPSTARVALSSQILAEQKLLVTKVIEALWEDFNGRGPASGMWWHGAIEEVGEDMPPLNGPADLLKVMRLSQIAIRKQIHGYEGPVVEMSFAAAFEKEHGVGILTDGKTILGMGYQSSVSLFKD